MLQSDQYPVTRSDASVVDDDEVFADFVVATLSSRSHQVCRLPNGESARIALCGPTASLRTRLILLDVEMPGLDGFGVLKHLVNAGVTRHTSVIMLYTTHDGRRHRACAQPGGRRLPGQAPHRASAARSRRSGAGSPSVTRLSDTPPAADTIEAGNATPVSSGEAFRFWLKLGFINFGGPAGQIAIMHRELVDRQRWVPEPLFLRALNFSMLLPGRSDRVGDLHRLAHARHRRWHRGRRVFRHSVHFRAVAVELGYPWRTRMYRPFAACCTACNRW